MSELQQDWFRPHACPKDCWIEALSLLHDKAYARVELFFDGQWICFSDMDADEIEIEGEDTAMEYLLGGLLFGRIPVRPIAIKVIKMSDEMKKACEAMIEAQVPKPLDCE